MAISVTDQTLINLELSEKEMILVLEIDGFSTIFTNGEAKELLRIGGGWTIGGNDCDGLPLAVGGFDCIDDQFSYISYEGGTSTTIKQTLNTDRGTGESIQNLNIALVDKDQAVTDLIAPGNQVTDILGRKCKVWLGFRNSAWKRDYNVLFRGFVDNVSSGPGLVRLTIAHPDNKKKSTVFPTFETELSSGMTVGATVANVDDETGFLDPTYTGPDGTIDGDLIFYVRINDEIMRYEGTSSGQLTSLTRGQLGTTAASHSTGDTVSSFYRINSTAIDTALKLMHSGKDGPFVEDATITNFVDLDGGSTVANAIYFRGVNVEQEYGLTIGDYVTTTGASNGANNVTLQPIIQVTVLDGGDSSYIVIGGTASFVSETATSGVVDFRSQYDVWGPNTGAEMGSDEVDVNEHLSIKSSFLSSFFYDFYITEPIEDMKVFLGEQVYNPASAFSIPRKARASIGYHIGPLPGANIKTLNSTNVLNPDKLQISRSLSRNFFNSVLYRFNKDALDGEFDYTVVTFDATSSARIPVGNKTLIIEAEGMRTAISGVTLANQATARRLTKYKFGAESIKKIDVDLGTGYAIEIGDIIIFDLGALQVSDKNVGTRSGSTRLFQVENRTFDTRRGLVSLDIVDTNFSQDARYGLISPSSLVDSGLSTNSFSIKESFSGEFGVSEGRKWDDYIGASVVVRSSNYAISDTTVITNVSANVITVSPALAFTPSTDYIMELEDYDNQPNTVKLVYAFMRDSAFGDGGIQYQML